MSSQTAEETVNVRDLAPGDIILAWRGVWEVLDPPLSRSDAPGGHGLTLYVRHRNTGETAYLAVTPIMEFVTLRAAETAGG